MQQMLKNATEKESRDWDKTKERLEDNVVDARQKKEQQKQDDQWVKDKQRAAEAEKKMPKEKAYRILGTIPGEPIPTK